MTERVTGPDFHFAVTFFLNYAATRKTEGQWTLAKLARRIETTTAREKDHLPWLKLATFGDTKTPLAPTTDGSGRHDGRQPAA